MQLGKRESDSTGVAKERLPKGWDEVVCFGCTQSDQGVWPCTRVYADIDDAAASTLPASCLVLLEYAYRGRCSPEGAGSGSDRIRACQGAITPRH